MAFSLAQPAHHELVIKKSRFIACVEPMAGRDEAQARVAQLKAEHPDAAHVCWALLAGGQSAANDDGEPGGTAGRPMLDVLRHQDLQGVMASVVRYFGGIKLGAGGFHGDPAAAMLEVLGEDYIRTARAKGVGEQKVFFKHTLRAVLAPLITMASLDFAGLIGGAIITETIFNLPGLGSLTLRSVYEFDLSVVLATTILAATVVIVMNLIVDMLYAVLDPRVRLT